MTGLRERKKRETRATIARATAEIARYEPVARLSIADIAKRAGVSQRTFHNYFASREEALAEFTFSAAKELLDSVISEHGDNLSLFDAIEEAVISGLKRNDDELTSLYSLEVLARQITLLPIDISSHEEQYRVEFTRKVCERFPEIDKFDLLAQLAAAAATAQYAVREYFDSHHDEGPTKGEELVRRAFAQLRTPSTLRSASTSTSS